MTDWRRPHGFAIDDKVSQVLLFASGLVFGAWFLYDQYRSGVPRPWPLAVLPVAMVIAGLVTLLRWNRMGVVVSDEGIRIRRFWRTRTLPWARVAGIDSAPCTATNYGFPVHQESIWIHTRERPIETPLISASHERTLFQWRSEYRTLRWGSYEQALRTLREAHERAGLAQLPSRLDGPSS